MATYHLLPVDDIKPHIECSTCHCKPTLNVGDNGDMLLVHNSFDGREEEERKKQKDDASKN